MTFPNPKTLKFEKRSPHHEAIFLDHYDWLVDWARQHTQGDAAEAEDLVQDLYVRFVQMKSGPQLVNEDEIRAYLYTSLKNLFISKKLRSGRDAVSGLLTVDFDSVAYAMAGVDRSQLLHVRSDLAGICEYACIRRSTNRSGSVLILRYFLGHLSTEVMALLRIKRSHVDTLIETARLEAKAFLDRPGVLSFLSRGERKPFPFARYLPEEPEALFAELQRRIFTDPVGPCFSPDDLRRRLLEPDGSPLMTLEAAHIASCRSCLGQATKILGLPDQTIQSFDGGGSSSGAAPHSNKAAGLSLKKLRRKLRETYEHRPKKLQIVVDGEVRGVQTITAVSSNVQIALPARSQPAFLEVLSEQGLGLLYFDLQVENVEVPGAQFAEVDLSDGRHLSISVSLVGGVPLIDLTYSDPLFDERVDVSGLSSDADTGQATRSLERTHITESSQTRWGRFLSALSTWRPWFVGVLAAIGVLAALTTSHKSTSLNASTLLTPSQVLTQAKENATAIIPVHGALHQVFSLEVRSTGGAVLSSSVVDSLRSSDQHLHALRLKSGDTLKGAHWVDHNGETHDFTVHTPMRTDHAEMLDQAWKHPPDAADFEQLAGTRALQLRQVESGYEVSFSGTAPADTPIIEGRLLVSRTTLLPYDETLLVRSGQEAKEYRFQQVTFEVLPPDRINANDFLPDAGSIGRSVPMARNSIDTAHLTLAVLQTLEQQPQEVQAAVDVERGTDGEITVSGVLSNASQVASITTTLRSLNGGSELNIKLHAVDEKQSFDTSHPVGAETSVSAMQGKAPLDFMLRDILTSSAESGGSNLDERVQLASHDLLEKGARIHRAAWVVDQIAGRDFGSAELASMSTQDRKLWLTLLAEPLKLCESNLNATSTMLRKGEEQNLSPPARPLSSVNDLRTTADSLRQHAERLDRLLTLGLAITTEEAKPELSPPELLDELAEAERAERTLTKTVQLLQQAIR